MINNKKHALFTLFLGLAISCFMANNAFSEPANLTLLRHEVKKYYHSGEYIQELQQQIELADQFILNQAQIWQGKSVKLAIVLDIDETSLSNYSAMEKRDFVGTTQQMHEDIQAANAPVIEPTLALYKYAQKLGITVFFVTGRNESERDATQKNLIQAGYTEWGGLYLRPEDYPYPSIIPFKSQTRLAITQQGYKIIANIGDQKSDLEGGYAEKGFKLPNPFYYLP